jgi:Fe-S cluster assembly ATPase SufC
MKLDRTKSFGVVYGHDDYQYVQGGVYFDGTEESIEEIEDNAEALVLRGDRKPDDIEGAKKFLAQVLKEGPIMKSAVFKEAEMNNQSWEAVTKARVLMNISEQKGPGGNLRWRLPDDPLH